MVAVSTQGQFIEAFFGLSNVEKWNPMTSKFKNALLVVSTSRAWRT
jgi:hypothetical protein